MRKQNRVSMKGMGADAFFGPESEQPTVSPGDQQANKAENQQTREAVHQQPTLPANQQTRKSISQQASEAVHQQPILPANQQTRKSASQQASETRSQQERESLIKVTYYITPELDLLLETIRLQRRQQGIKVDKSTLVREAIRLLQTPS